MFPCVFWTRYTSLQLETKIRIPCRSTFLVKYISFSSRGQYWTDKNIKDELQWKQFVDRVWFFFHGLWKRTLIFILVTVKKKNYTDHELTECQVPLLIMRLKNKSVWIPFMLGSGFLTAAIGEPLVTVGWPARPAGLGEPEAVRPGDSCKTETRATLWSHVKAACLSTGTDWRL